MALETLRGIKEIAGKYKVREYDTSEDIKIGSCVDDFIHVDHINNTITFVIQTKPVKENEGIINGCQVDTIIEVAKIMLEGLNKQVPHECNEMAINKLEMTLCYLKRRTEDRVKRGVEGTNKE